MHFTMTKGIIYTSSIKIGVNVTSTVVTDMNDLNNLPVLLDTQQVARLLNCSDRHVRSCLTRKQIQGAKIGGIWRVHRDELLTQLGLVSAND